MIILLSYLDLAIFTQMRVYNGHIKDQFMLTITKI